MLLMPNMPEVAAFAPRATPQTPVRAAVEPVRDSFSTVLNDASRTRSHEVARDIQPAQTPEPGKDAVATAEAGANKAKPDASEPAEEVAAEVDNATPAEPTPIDSDEQPDTDPVPTDVYVRIEMEVITPIDLGGLVAEPTPVVPATPVVPLATEADAGGESLLAQLAGAAVELTEAAIEALTEAGETQAPAAAQANATSQPAAVQVALAGVPTQAASAEQNVLNAMITGEAEAVVPGQQGQLASQPKVAAAVEPAMPVVAEATPQGVVQPVETSADQQAPDQQQLPTPQPQVNDAKPAAPAPTLLSTTPNPAAPVASPTPAPEGATQANQAQNAPALPQTPELDDAARVNEARISRGLQNAVHQGGGSITLRLTPAELGTVRIQMQLMGTSVSADIHTETEAARATLSGQITQLRQALESQGLAVDRLNVQSMSTSGSQPQQFSQSDQGADGRSRGFMGQEGRQREGSPQGQQDGAGGRRQRFDEALLGQAA